MILSSHEISLVVLNRVSDIVLDGMAVEKINKSRRPRNTGCQGGKVAEPAKRDKGAGGIDLQGREN
jgi:hypothetical protein